MSVEHKNEIVHMLDFLVLKLHGLTEVEFPLSLLHNSYRELSPGSKAARA
jgi:hypothetical protein